MYCFPVTYPLFKCIMENSTSKSKKVEVNSVELAGLKRKAKLGEFVENFAFCADVKKTRQNVSKVLTIHLLLDKTTDLTSEEVEDILILCEFLDNVSN